MNPAEHPHVCMACGAVNEAAGSAIEDLQRQLLAARAEKRKALQEKNSRREMDPHYEEAEETYLHWKETLCPLSREFNGPRYEAVIARLKAGHKFRDNGLIRRAIDGIAKRPYVTDARGRTDRGKPEQKNIDLELICRSETHLQRFASYLGGDSSGQPIIPERRLAVYQEALDRPDLLDRLQHLRGWEPSSVRQLGLGFEAGKVVFPICNGAGLLTGICRYQPNSAKRQGSKMLAEGPRDLFPAPETITADKVWLVEGEPDAVAAHSAGLAAVAAPGCGKWDSSWAVRFERFERVWIAFDCDTQGRDTAAQRQKTLGTVTRATVVDIDPQRTDGYDVGDLLETFGPDGARERLVAQTKARTSSVMPFTAPRLTDEQPFDRVLTELERANCKVKRNGSDKATAQCPVHEDRQPSMSIAEGDDGRVLFHCHAGCSWDTIIGALGIEGKDLFVKAV